ncbi:MAG TPA: exonuclease domain-containing protein [Spirochaetota bacterium]|mgnify:FL=1|jgi:DNA polymerase III epsilon subunit family exonuclease|nr:3'-5' exoribonuclease [Spirochaetota bacterium]OQA99455.1 MAG: DNA polymerase III PolC-type [Spirochaetes bacterium ADurb.Bin218]HON15310.1 exonuclease domain-containing protein [Spirochaetota bacterium]HOQ11299.1 exonuclease domain-containing protein [Spirochaetota bacterium]HOV07620.1 exonuclease domain-containing protein [Spirochaetota bacterium]
MFNEKLLTINFCAVDLETTGVNPAFDKIVEIGAVKFNLAGDKEEFHTLINPKVHIPYNVVRIHGITDEMVCNSPSIEDVVFSFYDFIKDSVLVVHNPSFDLSFIDLVFKKQGIASRRLWGLDTVRLARKFFCELPNHKLTTLASYLGIDCRNHRALDDAIVCMMVFLEVVKRSGLDENSTFGEFMNIHGARVNSKILREKSEIATARKIAIGKKITIRYCDTDGNVTVRNILPKEFIQYGKNRYIVAHCYLRGAERCFLESRIIGIE